MWLCPQVVDFLFDQLCSVYKIWCYSEGYKLLFGVPQGLIVSPLLCYCTHRLFLSKRVLWYLQTCFVQLFGRFRSYLTTDVSILVVDALISSHSDHIYSLFRTLFMLNLCKLVIQNSAACIVTNTCRFYSTTPVLTEFHWLPVDPIQFQFRLL